MLKTLDRYLIREVVPPFLLALGVFTFVLAVRPMLDNAQQLLSKGAPLSTVGLMLLLLLPQALGLTIPMAFLTGLLMAFGRLSGDRESVALLACGVSPARLLRPLFLLSLMAGGLTLLVMIELLPDANQKYREIEFRLLVQQTASDIKPRLFYEGFPGKVLYYRDTRPNGEWTDVLLADTSRPDRPSLDLAATGRLVIDRTARTVNIILDDAIHYAPGAEEGIYDTSRAGQQRFSIRPETVFGNGVVTRGMNEMTIADLRQQVALKVKAGLSPHNEIMSIHQKFSFPVACFVFALLGFALGLHTRKEGRLAGLALGIGVISIYYVLMASAEAWTKGHVFPAAWARWVPNIALGALGVLAVWWRSRSTSHGLPLPSIPEWLKPGALAARRAKVDAAPAEAGDFPGSSTRVSRLPRPRLLDLYMSRRYLQVVGLAFLGLLTLYYIGTFVDLSDKLFKGQASGLMLVQYLWYSTPQFISYIIPIAALVAVLGTIGAFSRTSELIVMRACGVSLYRSAVPLLVLSITWSLVLFGLQEQVLAESNRRAEALNDAIHDRPPRTLNVANRNWLAGPDGRIYYYVVFDASRQELFGLSVFRMADAPFRLVRHSFAKHAVAAGAGGVWHAEHGWIQEFPTPETSTRQSFEARDLTLTPPANFSAAQVDPDLMSYGELRAYIQRLGASGLSVADQRVGLHRKIAYPLAAVVMTVLGIPFGVTTGRRGALYGIGLAIVLAMGYWFLSAIFGALGSAGLLPPALAAWSTNVLFLAAAVYLLLTVRT